MIVISGALVLVALVLLIIGVVGPDLTFVYLSIGVSLVSLVFLVIGILQRRGETMPAGESASAQEPARAQDPAEGVTTVVPASTARGSRRLSEEPPVEDTLEEEPEGGGVVLVVEGRPRYHVVGCRYLSGKTPEAVDVLAARDEGFTPCGVCKPDLALATLAEEEGEAEYDEYDETEDGALDDLAEPEVDEDGPAPVVEEDVPGVEVPAPARRTGTRTTAKKVASGKAPARKAASTCAVGRPALAPIAPAPAAGRPTRAVVPAARAGSVVVIPDRGRYHRNDCRYVRDVDGAEVLTKSAATRQGYAACGACKP